VTRPPEEPSTGTERIVDAISDGKRIEWERERDDEQADPETLAALELIHRIARAHRGSPESAARTGDSDEGSRVWGSLVLRGPLGEGRNGEVYRAYDPGLQRELALKLWSPSVQPRTIERLLEEARALALVRHPNVLLVHGADVHDGQVGMWTELVEGVTLEWLIQNMGTGHWREVALYGIELSRALGAVHAIGFVHRDVKPENVMREHGGRLVLMDFGSATRNPVAADAPLPEPEGTPMTMAPEVLRGEPATPVSDVYSLGAVLFRMVTGSFPAEAGTLEELRATHARGPLPSARQLRPQVPLAFSRVLDRALERDPAARIASAAEFERLLTEALSSDWPSPVAPAKPAGSGGSWRGLAIGAAAALAVLAVGFGGAWWLFLGPAPGKSAPMQFTLQLPRGERLHQFANVVVSPDGRRIVYAAVDTLGKRALWVRRFDALASTRLPGTEGASNPFWSPDGRHIGFFSGVQLKRVGADGDSVRVICPVEYGRGGTWNKRGTILFAGSTRGPILRVSAEGGTPIPVTTLDSLSTEASHRWPHFLPDGEHFLFVTTPEREGVYPLFVGSLRSDRRVHVGGVGSGAVYTSGLLVYMLNHALEARPFDLRSQRWSGPPTPITSIPGDGGSIAEPHASASQNGTLVYSFEAARDSRLTWYNVRTGHATTIAAGPYFDPRLSPDGRRVAAERVESTGRSNVWLVDVATGHAERWTNGPGLHRRPTWSPDGDSIVFATNRSGSYELVARRADGSLAERQLLARERALMMWISDWQPGGGFMLDTYDPGTANNIHEWRSGVRTPVATTDANELNGVMSPDGRWIAFESNATGLPRIYLVDRHSSERYALSGEGGMRPRWARETGRLYFHTPAGEFLEVTPDAAQRPPDWPVRSLFRTGVMWGYDVDARGERVLASVRSDSDRLDEVVVLVNLPRVVEQGP
jgi:Tol biopolymer transport system component